MHVIGAPGSDHPVRSARFEPIGPIRAVRASQTEPLGSIHIVRRIHTERDFQ